MTPTPYVVTPLYTCQGNRPSGLRCGRPAVSILRAEGATADSAIMRAYCDDHDALALTAARWTLGWTHAVLDSVTKPCTACDPDQHCGGLEYQAHSCPCHHWDRQPLDEQGHCGDAACACLGQDPDQEPPGPADSGEPRPGWSERHGASLGLAEAGRRIDEAYARHRGHEHDRHR